MQRERAKCLPVAFLKPNGEAIWRFYIVEQHVHPLDLEAWVKAGALAPFPDICACRSAEAASIILDLWNKGIEGQATVNLRTIEPEGKA